MRVTLSKEQTLCVSCKSVFQDTETKQCEKVKCVLCAKLVHYECSGLPRNMNYMLKSENWCFFCDPCAERKEIFSNLMNKIIDLEMRNSEFSKQFESLRKEMNDIKKSVQSMGPNKPNNAQTPMRGTRAETSWAAMCSKTQNNATPTMNMQKTKNVKSAKDVNTSVNSEKVIVIRPKDDKVDVDPSIVKNKVRRTINPLTDPVTEVRTTSRGKTIIVCTDKANLDEMKKNLVETVGEDYEIGDPKTQEPKLKIVGDIDPDLNNEQLTELICKQNNVLATFTIDDVKHVYDAKRRYKHSVIYMSCPYVLFTLLLNKKKINIGWSKCTVYENLSSFLCFKCHKGGHIEKDCTSSCDICPKCGGDHRIKDCTENSLLCPNCHTNNEKYHTTQATNHLPWSFSCPIFRKKAEKRKEKIMYSK